MAPEQLTLDKLIALARSSESAAAALQDMGVSANANSTSGNSRGGGGSNGRRQPPPVPGMADYIWEHIKKLRAEKKCTRCAQSTDRCPNQADCWVLKSKEHKCTYCNSDNHLAGACARKPNNMPANPEGAAPKSGGGGGARGKRNQRRSNYQKSKNGGGGAAAEARATDDQQPRPPSDSDDEAAG